VVIAHRIKVRAMLVLLLPLLLLLLLILLILVLLLLLLLLLSLVLFADALPPDYYVLRQGAGHGVRKGRRVRLAG